MPTPYKKTGGRRGLFQSMPRPMTGHISRFCSDGIERLELAITRAGIILVSLLKDLKIIDHAHSLPEGYQLVRTDTGEAIAEAERIIREGNSNG